MEFDTQRMRELLDKRDALDKEIIELVLSGNGKQRAPQKCGVCGEEGHSARTCPKKARD